MAEALKLTGGEEAKETAHFIELVDKFFDGLNVTNYVSGKHSRKVFQDPFLPNDFRLKVSKVLMFTISGSCLHMSIILLYSG